MTRSRREVIDRAWRCANSKLAAEGSLTMPATSKPARRNASSVRKRWALLAWAGTPSMARAGARLVQPALDARRGLERVQHGREEPGQHVEQRDLAVADAHQRVRRDPRLGEQALERAGARHTASGRLQRREAVDQRARRRRRRRRGSGRGRRRPRRGRRPRGSCPGRRRRRRCAWCRSRGRDPCHKARRIAPRPSVRPRCRRGSR